MTQFLAYVLMMTLGSLIAHKFKTREKASAAFDKLGLDWISGIGLAFVIVACAVLAGIFGARAAMGK